MAFPSEFTTQQAAAFLGVSHPFLITQMKENKIPCHGAGPHRRVRVRNLVEYKKRIDADRAKVLGELAAQAQNLDMGY